MGTFTEAIQDRLAALRAAGLYRWLRCVDSPPGPQVRVEGRWLLSFASNDYLGLANHDAVRAAAERGVGVWGAGAGAARLLGGSLRVQHALEERLAAFKDTEAVLTFATGYLAALGTVPALVGPGDVVAIDKRVHACLVDAARLSGAKLRVFPHNDLDRLESVLKWAEARRGRGTAGPGSGGGRGGQVLVVTESVFSMDGDVAPLRELVELKDRYGAWLLVDEAHATGLYGRGRRGLAEAVGVAERIEVHMGTLGKALGAAGGFIAGSRTLVDYLIQRARSFLFSTAPVPAAAAAAAAAVELVQGIEGEQRCRALWERVAEFGRSRPGGGEAASGGRATGDAPGACGAVRPVIVGGEAEALAASAALYELGLYVPAIRYPTVPRGAARLRVTLTAAHSAGQVQELVGALAAVVRE
jgi:8-amino-7-oxononanoate synthase